MYFSRVRIKPDIFKSSQLARVLEGNVYGCHQLLWDLFPEQKERTFLYREEIAREQLGALPSVRGEPVYYVISQTRPTETEGSLFKVECKEYRPQLEVGQRLHFECRVNPVVSREGKKHDIVMDAQLQFLTSLVKSHGLESALPVKIDKGAYKKALLEKGGEVLEASLTDLLANDPRYGERLRQISSLAEKLDWAIKARIDLALEGWMINQGNRCGFALSIGDDGLPNLQKSAYTWHGLNQKTVKKGEKSGFSSVDFAGELEITDPEKFRQTLFNGLGRAKAFGCGMLMVRKMG
jgi:CRISPR system Cascade subunit CasE